jgi:hypothetical protein
MVFWITSRMKATKEQMDGELMVIKLFVSNYARDLVSSKLMEDEDIPVGIIGLLGFSLNSFCLTCSYYYNAEIHCIIFSLPLS